jgi:hypothetical protein
MALLGERILLTEDSSYSASTDMGKTYGYRTKHRPILHLGVTTDQSHNLGNVSHAVPSFHGAFAIPTAPKVSLHHPDFAASAGTSAAHDAAIRVGKGLAMLSLRLITEPDLVKSARRDFDTAEASGSA